MVVERVCWTESAQLCHLSLEPSVLLRQRLAAALQVLAVHLGLLQLRPSSSVLEPDLNLAWSKAEPVGYFALLFQGQGAVLFEAIL